MILELPSALLIVVAAFLPMDPGGIQQLRSCCRHLAQNLKDLNLHNFTLEIEPYFGTRQPGDERTEPSFKMPDIDDVLFWFERLRFSGAVRYLDLTTAAASNMYASVLRRALFELLTFPVGDAGDPNEQPTSDRRHAADHGTPADGSSGNTEAYRAALVDVLEDFRLAESRFSGYRFNSGTALVGMVFPVLNRLVLLLRTWWDREQLHPSDIPMADFARRFPRLSHLVLCCPCWDSLCWQPTVLNMANAPHTFRSLRLCFHVSAEETIVTTLASVLEKGTMPFLEEICLRSVVDTYDSAVHATDWDDEPEESALGSITYGDRSALGALGRGLGRLASSLRRLEMCVRCVDIPRDKGFWAEMAAAVGPRGMLHLDQVSIHCFTRSLFALTDLTRLGRLPAVRSLDLARVRASVPCDYGTYEFSGLPEDEWRRQAQKVWNINAASHSSWVEGLSLELSLLADGAPLSRLQTLSLGVDGANRRVQCSVQEKAARLLQSGRCPRLRRLWLFDGDPQHHPFQEHRAHRRDGAGADPERDTCGVAPGDAAATRHAKEASAVLDTSISPGRVPALLATNSTGYLSKDYFLRDKLQDALTSELCPPALAEAFAATGPGALLRPPPDEWWGP